MSDSKLWCVPVKHVANSTVGEDRHRSKQHQFLVDPEEESRDNDATTDRLGTKKSPDLEDSANYRCSCFEVDDNQRENNARPPGQVVN